MARAETTETGGTVLFLCGDVMTGRGIDQAFPTSVDPRIYESYIQDARQYLYLAERETGEIDEPISYRFAWGDALEVWKEQNPALKIINLETAVTTHDEPWPDKGINYRMHPENVDFLTVAEIDFCSLANNHTLDWQRPGLRESINTLDSAGVKFAGAGTSLEKAEAPAVLQTEEARVLVFAYGHPSSGIPETWAATQNRAGVNLLSDLTSSTADRITQRIKSVKKPGDIVIFSIHWGSNWGYDVPQAQVDFAHKLIDGGAVDLIHGHSSHHPRPIEVYKEKLILYGAGDFFNDYEGIGGHERFRPELVLMYFPELDPANGKLIGMEMVPMKIQHFRLNKVSGPEAEWIQERLDRESEKFGCSVAMGEENSLVLKW